MASFASASPSPTLHSLDPNAPGLRQRRNGGGGGPDNNSLPPRTADPPHHRGGGAATKPAAAFGAASSSTRSTLVAPPPRSSLCLQTSGADPVTPIKKTSRHAGVFSSQQPAQPFASGLFPAPQASTVSTFPASSSSSLGSLSSSWVCVYGIDASIQDQVLDRFASYGRIVHQKSIGVNAMAIRYDNPLSAGKALCQNRFYVHGYYCGTFAMSDNDTSLLTFETPAKMPGGRMAGRGAPSPAPASLFAPSTTASTRPGSGFVNAHGAGSAPADELDDIFQHRKPRRPYSDQPPESLCLRIMRWLVGLD